MIISQLKLSDVPQVSGVYQFKDKVETVLYVGKAINLRNRITTYIKRTNIDTKTNLMLDRAQTISWIETTSDFEALLLEAQLIKKYRPKFNVIWKDDKSYIYMEVTKEEFPSIHLKRSQDLTSDVSFGPFPSKRVISQMLKDVRKVIPYCTQSKRTKRPCFYSHLGLCFPCPGYIRGTKGRKYLELKNIYRRNIRQIKDIFSRRFAHVEKLFQRSMDKASQIGDFELAAYFRDKITLLRELTQNHYGPTSYIENPQLLRDTTILSLKDLKEALISYIPSISLPNRIECYDISNISGLHATGSMVTFIEGTTDKSQYKRFRVRNISKSNDFAMMQQVLDRRLSHREWTFPNLIVIDGGEPQLRAVSHVFKEKNIFIPCIGLAKRLEEVVVPHGNTYVKLHLPLGPALNLLKRIRDEAHRFAHRYHTYLRLKALTAFDN